MDRELEQHIRELVIELSARGARLGQIELSTTERADAIRKRLVEIYNAEMRFTGEGNQRLLTARGVVCKSMISHLMKAFWGAGLTTSNDKEKAITRAVDELPLMCDKLKSLYNFQPIHKQATEETGRTQDTDRTQKKNSGKSFRPWDTNCERMAKAYIRECKTAGKVIPRLAFIKQEIIANASKYPEAKKPSTIDKAFQGNTTKWKPELDKALEDRTHAGRTS